MSLSLSGHVNPSKCVVSGVVYVDCHHFLATVIMTIEWREAGRFLPSDNAALPNSNDTVRLNSNVVVHMS